MSGMKRFIEFLFSVQMMALRNAIQLIWQASTFETMTSLPE